MNDINLQGDINLSKEEKEVINIVLNKFKDFNTAQIVEYMHNEKAYKNTCKDRIPVRQPVNSVHIFFIPYQLIAEIICRA